MVWRVEPRGEERSELAITVIPFLNSDLSDAQKRDYESKVFGETIVLYLDNVTKGIDYYSTTGKRVRRNQFGSHPIYSP